MTIAERNGKMVAYAVDNPGLSQTDVGLVFDVTRPIVQRALLRAGINRLRCNLRHGETWRDTLTEHQVAVLGLVKDGLSDKEIAKLMGVAPTTITNTIYRCIAPKLGSRNRAHAVYLGMVHGLIDW